jgi:hypothetical protein
MFNCVEDWAKLKLQEDSEEAKEIKTRKASIIIHSLKESTEANPVTREENDEGKIVCMLH